MLPVARREWIIPRVAFPVFIFRSIEPLLLVARARVAKVEVRRGEGEIIRREFGEKQGRRRESIFGGEEDGGWRA